jgi:copper transport protein
MAEQRAQRRSWIPAARTVALFVALVAPSPALAHATLIASHPAANAHLSESPATIHLTFSEEVVPRLCQIRIVTASGEKIELSVVGDPHNVRAVSAVPSRLDAGSYSVEWRVLSADGHPAQGSFAFTVGEPVAPTSTEIATPPPPTSRPDSVENAGGRIAGAPGLLAAIRGAAMAALLGAAGLLLLALSRGNPREVNAPARRYCGLLTAAAAVLFVGHFAGWLIHTAPNQQLTVDWATTVIGTVPGKVELSRTVLVLLAAWALLIARRTALSGGFALAAVALSGAAGHSAAVTPTLSIPLKSIHLIAVSFWFGGLLWLILSPPLDPECTRIARRVSVVALSSVVIIAISGVAQALLIAPFSELINSTYGLVLGIKTALFLVLVGFGWYNRFRLLPDIDSEQCRMRLRASAGRESTLMLLVLLIAGLLAYVPTPHPEAHTAAIQRQSLEQ